MCYIDQKSISFHFSDGLLLVFFRFSCAMKPIFCIVLLLGYIQRIQTYKILVYSPQFASSHVNFMGTIADVLVQGGHDVVRRKSACQHFVHLSGGLSKGFDCILEFGYYFGSKTPPDAVSKSSRD